MTRLFKVLVLGGAMACTPETLDPDAAVLDSAVGDSTVVDSTVADRGGADASALDGDLSDTDMGVPDAAGQGGLVLCPGAENEHCPDGVVRDGFECCWGTSC